MNIVPPVKRVKYIVQYENAAAFQNVEGFVHLEVSVDRNACTGHHLLGPQGEIVGPCGGAGFDENVAMVTKMNEMLALGGPERISLPRCGFSPDDALRRHLARAEARQAKEERSAFRAGISVPALQHLMGHSQIHTTMLYVQLAPQDVWREYARAIQKRTRLGSSQIL